MNHLNTHRDSRSAFTLVEVLLAMGIAAILALSVYNIYSNGIRFDRTSERLEKFNNEVRWISESLSADLENMVPFTVLEGQTPVFACNKGSLQFVRATPDGLRVVRYYLKAPEKTKMYQLIIGQHQEHVSSVTNSIISGGDQEYLIRSEVALKDHLDAVKKGAAQPSGREEVLSMTAQGGSLQFAFIYQPEKKDDKIADWTEDCSPAKALRGVRADMVLLSPVKGAVTVRRDVYIPVEREGP